MMNMTGLNFFCFFGELPWQRINYIDVNRLYGFRTHFGVVKIKFGNFSTIILYP